MKKFCSSIAVLFAISMATPALATSLADLFQGETITVNDKIFSNWTLLGLEADIIPDLTQIEVLPLEDDPLNPGIRYDVNGQMFAEGDGYSGLLFEYDVTTLSGLPLIKDASLELTGFLFEGVGGSTNPEGAIVSTGEVVYDSNGDSLNFNFVSMDYFANIFHTSDSLKFSPQNSLNILNYVSVYGPYIGGFAQLDSFEQRFSQTPEPATMLLLGTGLVGVAGAARRRKKNQA